MNVWGMEVLEFSSADPAHMAYIVALAMLYAKLFNISAGPDDVSTYMVDEIDVLRCT